MVLTKLANKIEESLYFYKCVAVIILIISVFLFTQLSLRYVTEVARNEQLHVPLPDLYHQQDTIKAKIYYKQLLDTGNKYSFAYLAAESDWERIFKNK